MRGTLQVTKQRQNTHVSAFRKDSSVQNFIAEMILDLYGNIK